MSYIIQYNIMNIQEQIKSDLNIEVLVMIFRSEIVDKSINIGTFGLCGCDCVIAEKGDKVYLGHFPPTHKAQLTKELLDFAAEKVTIFTPYKNVEVNGEWKTQAKRQYPEIKASYITYSGNRQLNENINDRAVCWINGKIVSGFCTTK